MTLTYVSLNDDSVMVRWAVKKTLTDLGIVFDYDEEPEPGDPDRTRLTVTLIDTVSFLPKITQNPTE